MIEEKLERYLALATELELVMKDIASTYEYNYNETIQLDRQSQDIVHQIELNGLTDEELFTSAQTLRNNRQRRREYKDTYEAIGQINYHINLNNNKMVLDRLVSEIKRANKLYQDINKRTYVTKYKGDK